MPKTDWFFPSSNGESQIHVSCWAPEGHPKAVLQLCHGISEYIDRYDAFARYFAEHGYVVVGGDHLGHGKSAPTAREQDFFADRDGWTHVANDVRTIRAEIERRHPALPCYLFGHSMGSFVARTCLIRFPDAWDGAVICGTGWMPKAVLYFGRAFLSLLCLTHGQRGKSPFAFRLVFGSYSRQFPERRTPSDWLSRDPANVDAYEADPLCGRMPSVGLLRDMLRGMCFNETASNLRRMRKSTPVRFIAGAQDPVGASGKGVRKTCDAFHAAGMQDLQLYLVPEGRHEIFFDYGKERLREKLLSWLEEF